MVEDNISPTKHSKPKNEYSELSQNVQTEIENAQLKKENQKLKKQLLEKNRRRSQKQKAVDTKIQTEHAIHHFIHEERKNTRYEIQDLTPNKQKISFGKISDFWGSLEMYAYENNLSLIHI